MCLILAQEAVLKYSASHAKKWDFTILDLYCNKVKYNCYHCYCLFHVNSSDSKDGKVIFDLLTKDFTMHARTEK